MSQFKELHPSGDVVMSTSLLYGATLVNLGFSIFLCYFLLCFTSLPSLCKPWLTLPSNLDNTIFFFLFPPTKTRGPGFANSRTIKCWTELKPNAFIKSINLLLVGGTWLLVSRFDSHVWGLPGGLHVLSRFLLQSIYLHSRWFRDTKLT